MICDQCQSGTCARRGVFLSERQRQLCATDRRYADLFDKRYGVKDASVPACSDCVEEPAAAGRRSGGRHKLSAGRCRGCNPSLLSRGLNAAKALAHWAADGGKTTSERVREQRLAACEACPLFDAAHRQCTSCGCYVDAKVKLRREVCPAGKWLQETDALRPFDGEPTRHLIYHIWPVAGGGWWEWNVSQLLERIDQFDGVRSVAVLTAGKGDPQLDSVKTVQTAFAGHRIDNWIVHRNDARKREALTHADLINTLPRGDGHVTFSAHAKGVKHGERVRNQGTVQTWAETMYRVCLDDPESVTRALEQFPVVGSLRRYNRMARNGWHYSGTFYWFRNDAEFLDRGLLSRRWFATESWPGDVYEHHEAGCLFGEGIGDLYDWETMRPLIDELGTWEAARNHET